jgi:ABC-type branched-subunit amino acid transport system ATPase component/branched-subunit amino acid ABC-type transport system permease component
MGTWITFALIGLGSGAIYAAMGTGLVVTFKGTGVINFAAGAMAMWGAYVVCELRQTGDLVFPVIVIPDRVHLADELWAPVAIGIGVVMSALLGWAVHRLVFRPLHRAPVLANVVASVGLLVLLQALVTLKFGTATRVPARILPDTSISLLGASVKADLLILAGIAVAFGLALFAWLRRSRLGVAIQAAAENERGASLAGYAPERLSAVTWIVASTLVGLFAILASPTSTLSPSNYTLFVVPAIAAALVGRLSSLPATLAAGLGIGMFQSLLTYAQTLSWYPGWARHGMNETLPFLVIILVLFVFGQRLPGRGAVAVDRLPSVTIPTLRARTIVPSFLLVVLAVAVTSGTYRFAIVTSLIATVIALSLVLLTGVAGQISLAQAGFAGAAGFALSKLGVHVPFPLSMLLAALMAAALGAVVGVPALRIRGGQLAVVTLAAGLVIEQFALRNPSLSPVSGNLIPSPSLLGWDLGVRSGADIARVEFALLVLVLVTVIAIGVANVMRSATGRRFLAMRTNERAGTSLGVNIPRTKLAAFATASFIAGLAGCLMGYSQGRVSADSFGVLAGLLFLSYAYLGGITSIGGAFVAGLFAPLGVGYTILVNVIGDRVDGIESYYYLISGYSLIVTAIYNQSGIAGTVREAVAARRGRHAAPRVSAPPATQAPAEPLARSPQSLTLTTRELSVQYGGVHALSGVDLTIEPDRIVGLIGPNGAGKTTLIDAISGFASCRGEVLLGARRITDLAPHLRARHGVVRTWQSLELFDELSVRQNVSIGASRASLASFALDLVHPLRAEPGDQVDAALAAVGLEHEAERRPPHLSLGQQKLLGIARALAMSPAILLLDEPAAGLNAAESAALGHRLRLLAGHGVGILLVDHDMDLVLDVCDDVYVLDSGAVIAHGPPDEIRAQPAVIEAYLGSPLVLDVAG